VSDDLGARPYFLGRARHKAPYPALRADLSRLGEVVNLLREEIDNLDDGKKGYSRAFPENSQRGSFHPVAAALAP
jgi:hypothetical protein